MLRRNRAGRAGRAVLAGATLGAGLWASLAIGQNAETTPPPESPVFGETVEVRVVNVEVVVTDRDGLPVTGLGAADFRLMVDDSEQPIRYFSEVRGGTAVAEQEAAPRSGEIEGVPSVAPGEPVGASYLVFIDEFFPIERDRNRVLQSLRDDVGRLGLEDRMAIVAYDGHELAMLSSWTNSQRDLERALRDAQARPAYGLRRVSERRSFLNDRRMRGPFPGVDAGRLGTMDTRLAADERFYAEMLESQLQNVISASSAALRGFANPPGRKVLILLSGGWPYEVDEYVTSEFGRITTDPAVLRGQHLYAPLVDTANQLGYTIFAVDVPGLGGDGTIDAELDAVPEQSDRANAFLRENNLQFALERIASETGGKALLNSLRLEALKSAAENTRSYYWIGFSPPWKGDDRRHEVKVEVRRDGLKVGSRKGYVDFSRRAEVSAAVESVLLFGAGPGVRDLELEIGKGVGKGGTMQVPIVLSIPADQLTFLPAGGGSEARIADLELRVAAVDERGGRSDVPVLPIRLSLPGAPAPGARARYETKLELRRVKNKIAVAVYDPVSGAIWSKVAEVRP